MKLLNENIEKLQEVFFYGKYRLEKTYDPNEALYLYDFVTKLGDILEVDNKIEKNMALAVGVYKRNRYLKEGYKNFVASPDWLKTIYNIMKTNLDILLKDNDSNMCEDTVLINEYYMFGNILDYYEQLSDPNREYLFLRMKDKIYNCNNSGKQNHIFDDLYGKNGIFVRNDNDISTMANIVYELEHIFKKYNLSMIDNKAINKYVYYNSFNEVEALISKKFFLNYLCEKNPSLYENGVRKAYMGDYLYTLRCFEQMQTDIVKNEDYIYFIRALNYIYGQLLSDIYLSLDYKSRENFSNYLRARSTKLLGKDTFDVLLSLTGRKDYLELVEISNEQVKRNIK